MTRAALFNGHRKLAGAIAYGYRIPGAEAEDVRQEALVALWEATGSYDPARGPFGPFASLVVHNSLRSALTASLRLKQRVLNEALRENGEARSRDTADEVLERDEVLRVLWLVAGLTPLERTALMCVACGVSYREIEESYGLDAKQVGNAVDRARAKLRGRMA